MASVDTPAGELKEVDVEVAKIISDPIKMELARQTLMAEGEAVEVSELLRDHRGEVFEHVQRVFAAAGMKATFSMPKADEPDKVQVELSEPPKELSPEDAALTLSTANELKNLEQVEIDERLMSLVVQPINAFPEAQRTVKGRVRSGEEIARAIPDVEAFFNEVTLQNQNGVLLDFFELNEIGQLVMKDNCPEAYGLCENALQARMRQTRIVYRDENGQTKVMTGKECFKVTERDKESRPLEMEVSEAARNIAPKSILMARGLPTLKWNVGKLIGEYARMNTGQFEKAKQTWTDDDSLDGLRARNAAWDDYSGRVHSSVRDSNLQFDDLGSRGVLRVNLNLES